MILPTDILTLPSIEWVPGKKNMWLKDFPSFLRTTDPNDVLFNYLKGECQAAKQATAIIACTHFRRFGK